MTGCKGIAELEKVNFYENNPNKQSGRYASGKGREVVFQSMTEE